MKTFFSSFKTLPAQAPRPAVPARPLQSAQPVRQVQPPAVALREAAVASVCASARRLAAAGLPIGPEELVVWAGQLMAAEREVVAAMSAEFEGTLKAARWATNVLESTTPPSNFTTNQEPTHD